MATIDLSKLRIGDGVKSDYTRTEFSTSDVIRSLSAFSEEHFRGILSLAVINNDSGIITICADGFAFFLKLLLYRVFGRTEIKTTVNCERCQMHITLDLCGIEIDTTGLCERAERSGFRAEIPNGSMIKLTTDVKRTHALRVYAGNADTLLHTLYAVFFMNI